MRSGWIGFHQIIRRRCHNGVRLYLNKLIAMVAPETAAETSEGERRSSQGVI